MSCLHLTLQGRHIGCKTQAFRARQVSVAVLLRWQVTSQPSYKSMSAAEHELILSASDFRVASQSCVGRRQSECRNALLSRPTVQTVGCDEDNVLLIARHARLSTVPKKGQGQTCCHAGHCLDAMVHGIPANVQDVSHPYQIWIAPTTCLCLGCQIISSIRRMHRCFFSRCQFALVSIRTFLRFIDAVTQCQCIPRSTLADIKVTVLLLTGVESHRCCSVRRLMIRQVPALKKP